MSNIKDQIPFADFGLNTDDAHRYTPKGSSPHFLNCLKGEDGWTGELTNLKGNRKVTYPLGNSNAYFVLASCYDPLTRNVYYWIFSQPYDVTGSGDYEYDNRLVRFNEDSEVIDTIFYDTKNYFGLDPNTPFKDSFVLGDWLFFNPQKSEPKMICITMAFNYTKALKGIDQHSFYDNTASYVYGNKVAYLGGIFLANIAVAPTEDPVGSYTKWDRIGDSYQNETDIGTNNPYYDSEFRYAFNVIKHISVHRPVCIYASDTDKNANNVRGKLFRFATRYKYFDNSYTRYSSYSDITLPLYDEYYNGEVPGDLDQFNCIDVSVDLHSAALVKEIDIIFQETGGDWKRAKIVNRRDILILNQLNYTYRFYNTDSAYEAIDDTYFYESHDAVPKKANSQELINKNILCYGGCTEGFDNIPKNDIAVSLTPEIEAITIPYGESLPGRKRDNIANNDWKLEYFSPTFPSVLTMTVDPWFATEGWTGGDIFILTLDGKTVRHTFTLGETLNNGQFKLAISSFIHTEFPTLTVHLYNFSGVIKIGIVEGVNISVSTFYEPSITAEVALTKKRGFKTGAWHPFCLYYYDAAMRRWDAQTSKDLPEGTNAWEIDGTTVYVPMFNEISPVPATTANKWNIFWEVFHTPPLDSDGNPPRWWRWGYAGNALCESKNGMVQYIIGEVEHLAPTFPMSRMDITPLQTLKTTTTGTWNQFPQSIIEPYAYRKGDRVRIITEVSVANNMGAVIDGVYDYEIIKYEEDTTVTPTAYWIYTQDISTIPIGTGIDCLVEIYTPIKTATAKTFYEFGNLMPIIEDANGWVHGCGSTGTQNQDTALGIPATGIFEAGDVFHILRTPSKSINNIEGYFHESLWYSDFYDSDDYDKGRIGVESNFGERFLNIVRISEQYLQNTLINGLSTFIGFDPKIQKYQELNDVYGEILRIIEIGDTLKVYQRKKPSSMLIGKTVYYGAGGEASVQVNSNRVLDNPRYSNTNYGTEFPESISRNNRYVYGFDIYNGVMWRDSANGIFPISGRYESSDGGGDFKMETYFKQKAKDLLVSGIGGVSVLTVWDERHDNLYVIFKDIVTEANDEAIMFHEPSNRWICFTNMDQTPVGGWNQILELDWYILWGFDGGIGYLFNEDTRFAEFALSTSASAKVFPDLSNIILTSYNPTTQSDSVATPSFSGLKIGGLMGSYDPTILVTWVHITEFAMSFDYDEHTEDDKQSSVIDTYPSLVTLTSKPTWVTVRCANAISVGETFDVSSGIIYIYPSDENWGALRSGSVVLTNAYGDTDFITVTQGIAPTPPILNIYTEHDALMTLGDTSASSVGGTVVTLVFTPGDLTGKAIGESFKVYWRAFVGGDVAGNGNFMADYAWSNIEFITILIPATIGSSVTIYLIEDQTVNVTTFPIFDEITMDSYDPLVISSTVGFDLPGVIFLAADETIADEQHTVLTSTPTGASYPVRITGIPTKPDGSPWIRVTDVMGNPYNVYPNVNSEIYDGYTIYIFPIAANTEISAIGAGGDESRSITFENIMGDTTEVLVTQAGAAGPPGTTIITGTVALSAATISAGWTIMGSSAGYTTTSLVDAMFEIYNPTAGDLDDYYIFARVFINGINRTFGDIYDDTFMANVTNGTCHFSIPTTTPLILGDVIVVYFANYMSNF